MNAAGAPVGSAVARLLEIYEHGDAPIEDPARPIAGLVSSTVPWELVRAAGLSPMLLRSTHRSSPLADEFLEEDVFSPRIRSLFGAVMTGEWMGLRAVFIARTSEQDYKLYLYLREMAREGLGARLPPIFLYDLLHSRTPEAFAYGLERTHALKATLESLTGRAIHAADLDAAIAESNAARAAVRRILALRRDRPRVTGAQALALVGPFFLMSRAGYASLANEAADELEGRVPLSGARLLIKGAPLDHAGLHRALESHGAVVVAEDDGWGARAAGADVATDRDPITAIFEKYYADTPSPRVFPPTTADAWFEAAVSHGVDGVVFYLPPDDSVAGWDYPRERAQLERRGVPSLVVRADAPAALAAEWSDRIAAFVRDAAGRGLNADA